MKCPICGCRIFYVKDPDDAYETHEFSVSDGAVSFVETRDEPPVIDEKTRVYCNKCSWHGFLREMTGG